MEHTGSQYKNKWLIALSGASGMLYAQRLIHALSQLSSDKVELALVFSDNAKSIWEHEIGTLTLPESITIFENHDFYAPVASGSCDYQGMIICPASMGMLGRIASGVSNDLITRAADVMLKERRALILVPRETPYNLIHLNNMTTLTQAGAIICPATPSFYSKPTSIEQLVDTVVERIISLTGIPAPRFIWGRDN